MMKTTSFIFILAVLFSLFSAKPVSAHGGEPRLEINAERLNPGSLMEVRGVDFEFEEEVSLTLIGRQYALPLGTVTADTEGVFLIAITLPADLTEGTYVMRATTDDHIVESAGLTVSGTADLGGGEVSEQENGLLAPMPTYAPAVSSSPVPASGPSETAPQRNTLMPYVWIAAGMAIAVMVGLLVRRR